MGGFFGVASSESCAVDIFYGTDYHCHLGTRRGGMAVIGSDGFTRSIHDISHAQFKSKFVEDIVGMQGTSGIGVISDFEDQPLRSSGERDPSWTVRCCCTSLRFACSLQP